MFYKLEGGFMIITFTLNPALDKTVEIANLQVGEVNRISSMRLDGGGKGINVSKVLKSMGQESVAMGIVGGNNGNAIKEYLAKLLISNEFVQADGETRVNLKIIDTVNGTNTDINESGFFVGEEVVNKVKEKLEAAVNLSDIVVFAGSIPKGVSTDIYFTLTNLCKSKGAKVFLDVDGEMFKEGIKAVPYLIKPNINELEAYFGRKLENVQQIAEACTQFIEMGIEKVVVSLGGDGALFITKDKTILGNGVKVRVKSTVGAGDSMVASLVLSEIKNHSLEETVKMAIATSAANVTVSGTQPAEFSEILKLTKLVSYTQLN